MDTMICYSGFWVYVAGLGLELYLLSPPDPSSMGIATLLIDRNSCVLEALKIIGADGLETVSPSFSKIM